MFPSGSWMYYRWPWPIRPGPLDDITDITWDHAMGLKVGDDGHGVEGVYPQAEVDHVVPSHGLGAGDEIHNGSSSPELEQARLGRL